MEKKMKRSQKKPQLKTQPKTKWFVMRGFKKDNKDEVGFLSMSKDSRRHVYKIVDDTVDAMKFPSENVLSVSGFGTPKQWLEFFKGEPELRDWKFHLVNVER